MIVAVRRLTVIVAALLGLVLALAIPTQSHAAGTGVTAFVTTIPNSNEFSYKAVTYGWEARSNESLQVCVELYDVQGQLTVADPCRPIGLGGGSYPSSPAFCRAPGLVMVVAKVVDEFSGNILDSDTAEGHCGSLPIPEPAPETAPRFVPPLIPAPFCKAQFKIVVPTTTVSTPLTLRVEYADGTADDRVVWNDGGGLAQFSFAHEFAHGFGARVHLIKASLLETGGYSLGYVVHPDPLAAPLAAPTRCA